MEGTERTLRELAVKVLLNDLERLGDLGVPDASELRLRQPVALCHRDQSKERTVDVVPTRSIGAEQTIERAHIQVAQAFRERCQRRVRTDLSVPKQVAEHQVRVEEDALRRIGDPASERLRRIGLHQADELS